MSSLVQMGIGVPQKRLRETAQSRASRSQLANRPSRTKSGTLRTKTDGQKKLVRGIRYTKWSHVCTWSLNAGYQKISKGISNPLHKQTNNAKNWIFRTGKCPLLQFCSRLLNKCGWMQEVRQSRHEGLFYSTPNGHCIDGIDLIWLHKAQYRQLLYSVPCNYMRENTHIYDCWSHSN